MSTQIPEIVTQCRFYGDNRRLLGTGTLTLPTITRKSVDIEGAGFAGVEKVPILGNFEAMTATVAYRTITEDLAANFTAGVHSLEARAIIQARDAKGDVIQQRFSAFMRVRGTSITSGSAGNAAEMGVSIEHAVSALTLSIDDKVLFNIDVQNNIAQFRAADGQLVDDNEIARQWLSN